jgi:hypothetical protein
MEFTTQLWVAFSNNPTLRISQHLTIPKIESQTGFSPSMMPYPKGLGSQLDMSDVHSIGHNSETLGFYSVTKIKFQAKSPIKIRDFPILGLSFSRFTRSY